MKRYKKCFTAFCLITAALFSFAIGAGLPRIQHYSADIIARRFPVSYKVTYRAAPTQPVYASVRFETDNAIVISESGHASVPISEAVFVCMQNELRSQNMLRSGLLTVAIILGAAYLSAMLATTAFSVSASRLSRRKKPRLSAPTYPAARSHASKVPSAA